MQRKMKCIFMICLWIFLGIYSMGCQKKEDVILPSKEMENVSKETENTAKEQTEQGTKEAEKPKMITIYVCGEIQNPDVYELPQTARIYDAIEAAGGMKETAAKDALNLAEPLVDGQQIKVLSKEEALAEAAEEKNEADTKVNLNTAGKEELMTLPGIGESKAESIISYRESSGGFKSIEDIMQIEGIKEGVFKKIRDKIKI